MPNLEASDVGSTMAVRPFSLRIRAHLFRATRHLDSSAFDQRGVDQRGVVQRGVDQRQQLTTVRTWVPASTAVLRRISSLRRYRP